MLRFLLLPDFKSIVVVHLHDALDLADRIKLNSDQDQQRSTSEEHRDRRGEVEELLYERRNQGDER